MEVVVAKRRSAGDVSVSPERHPDKLTDATRKATKAMRTSVKFHHVAAFRVAARHAVFRPLGLGNFEHGTAHVALNLEGFRCFGGLWRIERAPHILGPSQRIRVLVLVLQFGLLQRQTHLTLSLSRLATCRTFRSHVYRLPVGVVVFNRFASIHHSMM